MTAIVLSEKPLNVAKIKAALGKKSADEYFEFMPQVKLVIDAEDNITLDAHLGRQHQHQRQRQRLDGDVVIEGGRARGTAKIGQTGRVLRQEVQRSR